MSNTNFKFAAENHSNNVENLLTTQNWFTYKKEITSKFLNGFGRAGQEIKEEKAWDYAAEKPFRTDTVSEDCKVLDQTTGQYQIVTRTRSWKQTIDAPNLHRDLTEYNRRFETYENYQGKLFGFLMNSVTPEVYDLVTSHADYATIEADTDTLKLWKLFKQVVAALGENTCGQVRQRWHMLRQTNEETGKTRSLRDLLAEFDGFLALLEGTQSDPSDKDKVSQLMTALTKNRYNFVTTPIISGLRKPPTYKKLKTLLLTLEDSGTLEPIVISQPKVPNTSGQEFKSNHLAMSTREHSHEGANTNRYNTGTNGGRSNYRGTQRHNHNGDQNRSRNDNKRKFYERDNSNAPPPSDGTKCQNCDRMHGGKCRLEPAQCNWCLHLGHLENHCKIKKSDVEKNIKRSERQQRTRAKFANVNKQQNQHRAKRARFVTTTSANAATVQYDTWDDEDDNVIQAYSGILTSAKTKQFDDASKDEPPTDDSPPPNSSKILLDTGASISIFVHSHLPSLHSHPTPLDPTTTNMRVVSYSGEQLRPTARGIIPGLGKYVVIPQAQITLLSVTEVTKNGSFNFAFIGDKCYIDHKSDPSVPTLVIRHAGDGFYITEGQFNQLVRLHHLANAAAIENIAFERANASLLSTFPPVTHFPGDDAALTPANNSSSPDFPVEDAFFKETTDDEEDDTTTKDIIHITPVDSNLTTNTCEDTDIVTHDNDSTAPFEVTTTRPSDEGVLGNVITNQEPTAATTMPSSTTMTNIIDSEEDDETDVNDTSTTAIKMDGHKYSKEQKQRAAEVIKLHSTLCHPSDKILITALNSGLIIGTQLTPQDVHNARAIYGPCIHCIAGKTVRKPYPQRSQAPPAEKVGDIVHVDIYVFGTPTIGGNKHCLFSVDEYSGYIHFVTIKDKTQLSLEEGFYKLIGEYKSNGHTIKKISTDSETNLTACQSFLGHQGVKLHQSPPYQHAQRVERYVRTVKDRMRTLLDSLPYHLPTKLYGELINNIVTWLNDTPNTIRLTQTPRMVMEGTKLDLNRRKPDEFGSIAMFHYNNRTSNNKMVPRAELGIILGPATTSYNTVRAYLFSSEVVAIRSNYNILQHIPKNFTWKLKKNTQESSVTAKSNQYIENIFPKYRDTTQNTAPKQIASQSIQAVHKSNEATTLSNQRQVNQSSTPKHPSMQHAATQQIAPQHTPKALHRQQYHSSSSSLGPPSTSTSILNNTQTSSMNDSMINKIEKILKTNNAPSSTSSTNPKHDMQLQSKNLLNQISAVESAQQQQYSSQTNTKTNNDTNINQTNAKNLDVSPQFHQNSSLQQPNNNLTTNSEKNVPHDKRKISSTPNTTSHQQIATTTRTGRTIKQPSKSIEEYVSLPQSKKRKRNNHAQSAKLQYKACRTSVTQALKGPRSKESKQAIIDEIQNMLEYNVGKYIQFNDIPVQYRKNLVRSFMFLKDKVKANGEYDRTKARLVLNGKQQNIDTYDFISSSTVAIHSVMLLLNYASYKKAKLTSYDVKGAFLNATYNEDEPTYMVIGKEIAEIWIQLDPTAESFINKNGELIVQLDKYIYGLKQAPIKFQQHLQQILLQLGYTQSAFDDCVFFKRTVDGESYLSTHVDDILQVSTNSIFIKELSEKLIEIYKSITQHTDVDSYLGMSLKQSPDLSTITLCQDGYTIKLLEKYSSFMNTHLPPNKIYSTPASTNLFDMPTNNSNNTPQSQSPNTWTAQLLPIIMSLMYLARLTRPDILLPVTFLATRSHIATKTDAYHVARILNYLQHNVQKVNTITIKCTGLTLFCDCDASYGIHSDGKSQTGYIVRLGQSRTDSSYLASRSIKQKLTAISSTDAEIIALTDATRLIIWLQQLINQLFSTTQHANQPAIITQDNKSAIHLTTQSTKLQRSRHILTKISFIKDQIINDNIILQYLPTQHMTADMLTKPLQGQLYSHHIQYLF